MAKDATFKELAKDVLDMVIGESPMPDEEQCARMDVNIAEKAKDIGLDEILPLSKKVLNFNILEKNVNFKIFEYFPTLWRLLSKTAIDLVAVENKQIALAK